MASACTVRSISAVVSVMSAPPSEARVCWKLSESEVIRYETLMAVGVTPAAVGPPLLPENAMHGGEYGSPDTCSVCPGHDPVFPVAGPATAAVLAAAVEARPAAAPAPPAAPAVPPAAAPVAPAAPVPPPARDAPAVSADCVSCTTSCCGAFVGTSIAISTKATRRTASGPYPFSSLLLDFTAFSRKLLPTDCSLTA